MDADSTRQTVVFVEKVCPAPEFAELTYPRLRHLLTKEESDLTHRDRLVVGALCGGVSIGLALYSREYGEGERRLLSVFVDRRFRRRGIALELLDRGERVAMEKETTKLVAFHSNQTANYAYYEGLVQKAGWSSPQLFEYRLAGKARWVYDAERDWAKFLTRVRRGGYAAKSWDEVTEADNARLADIVAHEMPEADRAFDPLNHHLPDFMSEISVLLYCGDDIAGWVLGAKGAVADTYNYKTGYALPKYQKRGYLIVGMMEVCHRQAELFGPETLSTYETNNAAMQRVMHKQIKPYSEWTDERFVCEKILVRPAIPT